MLCPHPAQRFVAPIGDHHPGPLRRCLHAVAPHTTALRDPMGSSTEGPRDNVRMRLPQRTQRRRSHAIPPPS
eukprot:7949919-Pyramimonas_sp.AAC.1